MPTSTNYFKQETKEYILKKYDKSIKILDIGAGIGTYSDMLKPEGYLNIDCVEVFENYVEQFKLKDKYQNVFIGDVTLLNIDFNSYDLIIIGDVLEHISVDSSIELINKLTSVDFIVCVPFESPQGEHYGNKYEIHLQEDLTLFNFLERYPSTSPYCLRFDYGIFTNTKNEVIYIETGEHPLPENYFLHLIRNNKDSIIENVQDKKKDDVEFTIESENIIKNNSTTIVTALWDLGRGEISEGFKRNYSDYLNKFGDLLKTDIPMYIFADKSDEDFIWSIRNKSNTVINFMSLDELKSWFSFTNETELIRQKPEWLSQASWLSESPQAKLSGYNPLVMSKMFMLNNVTIWDPFSSDYFFWIDAGITNTVHYGYFTHDKVFDKLPNFTKNHNDFIFLTYPYEGGNEIHGFTRDGMAKYCNTDYVRYVCRGGFFGGEKKRINEINGLYYYYLSDTLKSGLMGTEESVFTIVSHKHENLIHNFSIGQDGLVWPFFEKLKDWQHKEDIKNNSYGSQPTLELPKLDRIINESLPMEETALYVIGFNSPNQFKTLIHSMMSYDKNFIDKPKKYLLNNSTDLSTTDQYVALCTAYGFEHIKKDNIGITGGRQWIAEHFNDSNHKYYFFFEDDMFFSDDKTGYCRNGFSRYSSNLYDKLIKLMNKEKFDFIKMNYSEFFGDNGTQWAWYNVPQAFRQVQWPDNQKLPEQGLDPNSPRTKYETIQSLEGLPYATGDVFYCNWPQIMSKDGNKKCFIDTKFASPYEQTIMSFIFQETVKGVIKPAILMLTPTDHNRFEHYAAELRKEC
jgi:hypothetical protein